MPAFSEADEVRAEIQAQLRYNSARGWVLVGFWLLVFVLRVLFHIPVAVEILLGLGVWLGVTAFYAVSLRRCTSVAEMQTLTLRCHGRHLLVVGDVAGHGVASALTMSATMMAMELSLQSVNGNGHAPTSGEVLGQLAREVDQFLTRRIGGESFVTAFFALYDERDASLVTLDLGHSHVLAYIAASGKAVPPRWVGERHLPLMASQYVSANGANGHEPRPWPLRIEPGDTLVLYTDGLVEARNGEEEYGVKRLRQKIAELGTYPAKEIVHGLMESVTQFTGGSIQRDDVTVVVVKRTA